MWKWWSVIFSLTMVAGRGYYQSSAITGMFLRDFLYLSESASSAIVNVLMAFGLLCGLFGGALADTFFGLFDIIWAGSVIGLLAILLLFTSCLMCSGIHTLYVVLSVTALFIMGMSGLMFPCITAFVGEQFGATFSNTKASLSSAYNWFYTSLQIGSLSAALALPILLDSISSAAAYGTMLLVFGFVVILFFSMSKSYYRAPPKRETYPVAGKIIWAALKRCNCSSSGSCLDSAKKYHDPVQVEEVKSALDVLSVLYVMPLFWGVFFQIYSIWIFQASKMDCQFGSWTLPYSQVAILNPAFDIILIILFDRLLWPFCRRLGLPLKPLRKIGVGFIFTIAALLIAGSVELSMENSDNLVSILWILPQFFVISLAEILLAVTAYEIAYTQAPDSMKGFVTAMWEFTLAIGNVITALLVLMPWTSSTNSFILAGIICFAMILYLLLSWRYSKILARKEKLIAGMELDKRKKNTESNFS